jgi:epoxyqueuosine reductase
VKKFFDDRGNSLLKDLGVLDWGVTNEFTPRSLKQYQQWLTLGKNGKLNYLAGDRAIKRESLKNIFPDFKQALVFIFDYTDTKKILLDKNIKKIASYALEFNGVDYHLVLKDVLEQIAHFVQTKKPCTYTLAIDTKPILERDLAFRAGLGWFGKNSMLINQKHGSFFLIGSILFDQELIEDSPKPISSDHCGTCRRCIDLCPTQAILENRTLDANKCISTFTIETFKEEVAPKGYDEQREEFFGCDICQEVCPWNFKPLATPSSKKSLNLTGYVEFLLNSSNQEVLADLEKISNREYRRKLAQSPLARPGRTGMIKNLKTIIGTKK